MSRGLDMSQQIAGQQRTAAYRVVPVRLARKNSPLSGIPEVTPYSLGFSITRRRRTLTDCYEFSGGHQDKWGLTHKEKRMRDLGLYSLKNRRLRE